MKQRILMLSYFLITAASFGQTKLQPIMDVPNVNTKSITSKSLPIGVSSSPEYASRPNFSNNLHKINTPTENKKHILKVTDDSLTEIIDATDENGTVTGLSTITKTNIAALRTTQGTKNQMIQTLGYYTANDGGGWSYIWNSTSTDSDDGGSIIAVTGVSAGRWEYIYKGLIYARAFGVKADGTTDDLAAMNNAVKYAISKGGQLCLGTGVITITNTLNLGTTSPAAMPSLDRLTIIGQGPGFDPNTSNPAFTPGTTILLKGTGRTAVLDIKAGLSRYLKMRDFSVVCETSGGAEYGILWSQTSFSQHNLERVHSYKANKAFGVLSGGYANGEFTHFLDCKGSGNTHFYYMANNTGQAFNQLFTNCHGSVNDGGTIFEIGGGGLGFGMTLINFNSSNPIMSNFAEGRGVTFLKNNGITGIFSVEGGRVEQVSTLVHNVQGTTNISGKITIRNVHFDGMQSSGVRRFIKTTAADSQTSLQFEHCIFSPIQANKSLTCVFVELGQYSQSEYRFFKCSFGEFPTYDLSHTQTTKGKLIFDDCQRTNLSVGGAIHFSKRFSYNDPMPAFYVHKPQNFLLQSGFNSETGPLSALTPWVHIGNNAFFDLSNNTNNTGNYSSDTRFRQFALQANSAVTNTIASLTFGTGENAYLYRAWISFHGAANQPFIFALENSVTNKVYDRITLYAPATDGDLMQIDLLANDTNVGGNLRLRIQNPRSDFPTRVNLYGQYVYTNPVATFIETTTESVNHGFAIR